MFTQIFSQPQITLKRAKVFDSACLIFNPVSGGRNAKQDLEKIKFFLEPHIKLDIHLTTPEIGADQLAKEAVERGVELIIASGGDGTVSAAANAVIGTNIPLAIIPGGTANAFANGLGLPITLEESCIAILQGAIMSVDTARCNDQPMLLLAGIGFEANTVKEADRQLKDRFGIFAYIFAGLDQLQRLESFEARLETENQIITVNAAAITVANFAPPTSILAQGIGSSSGNDGLLDVTIISPANALEALTQAIELFESGLIHSNSNNHHIGYLRVQKINIVTNPSQAITVDGEMLKSDTAFFEIVPASLQVISSYQQVIGSQRKLMGLPSLTVVENNNQDIQDLVLNFALPVDLSRIMAQIVQEIGEQLLSLWHTLTKAAKLLNQSLIEAMIYLLWNISKKINESVNIPQTTNVNKNIKTTNLTVSYQISHHILGRIRLRIPRLRNDEKYGHRLQSLIESVNGVEKVYINWAASSIRVNYTPTLSSIQFQHQLIEMIEQAA
ncbi:YegS/Rv2252/BmrU family lipid kinase [Gloeothece verrucosa]|uniref:Diacylglycerol kinase catalytic region n=1 Tax=Gloeothece verrucosa (strain PCC 7822) TaxID=497965 RepID=E0UKP5_GLOV7|nr:YegS/Rv2252/BmrU family lipid kinase [Gloeothece verrucosa]ADN17525.1 diacylglycerol kinase catalytic region [Gloeothece verrucosa PCC 7822]